ncbi:MAG TPA: TlpA disulfide reductase family protein, partial [Parapedobacter sp.]|nr:TlpA disulfide reductase family protein [Parapedobacter sp.]
VEPIGEAKISGVLHRNMAGDTLVLSYWKNAISKPRYRAVLPAVQIPVVITKEGKFEVTIPIYEKAQYASLKSGMKKQQWIELYGFDDEGKVQDLSKSISVPVVDLDKFILEPGDEIKIDGISGDLNFSGKGAHKIKFLKQVANDLDAPKELMAFLYTDALRIHKSLSHYDACQRFALNVLREYRGSISSFVFDMLTADIVGENQIRKINLVNRTRLTDSVKMNVFLDIYKSQFLDDPVPLVGELTNEALGLSVYFSEFMLGRLAIDESYHYLLHPGDRLKSREDLLETILAKYDGLLGDKMATLFCSDSEKLVAQAEFESQLARSLNKLEDPFLKSIIQRYKDDFSRGATAYNFTMLDKDGREVQLKDFLGKVVFVDMWFTGCGACQWVAEGMREFERDFKDDQDVVFLSISIDKNRQLWLNSITKDAQTDPDIIGYQFPGAYYSGERSIYLNTLNGSDDPFIKKYVTRGYPTLLLIDKKGEVFSVSAPRPTGEEGRKLLMDQINEARHKS